MRELLFTALEAAQAATAVHTRYAGTPALEDAREKGTSDFVSRVDIQAQRAALAVIRRDFPDHRIVAEEDDPDRIQAEGGARGPASGPLWIVDPLDGTTNYLHGHPQYAASVGVLVDGAPAAGAVMAGASGERWWALRGGGAWKDGRRIRVSSVRALDRALVGTGFPFKRHDFISAYLEQFGRVLPTSMGIRRGGSAALDLCALASGVLDAFWELVLKPWDIAAGLMILQEAGGTATRMDGSPLTLDRPESVLAGNSPELVEALDARLHDRK